MERDYGRWLTYLKENRQLDGRESPRSRVTPERIARYVDQLQTLNTGQTPGSRLIGLYRALRALEPHANWNWLGSQGEKLRKAAAPSPYRSNAVRSTSDLFKLGKDLMASADTERFPSGHMRAVRYRDGLMISLLAARPLRLANFTEMKLAQDMMRVGNGFAMYITSAVTKNWRHVHLPVPEALNDPMERYLDVYRTLLLRDQNDPHLWISLHGIRISEHAIYANVVKHTTEAFGYRVTPHHFRHSAATTLAEEDPTNYAAAVALLGLKSTAVVNSAYNKAKIDTAAKFYQEEIVGLRQRLRRTKSGSHL